MKKPRLTYRQLTIIIFLFTIALGFIYPYTISSFNGDSNQYFSWVKDFYTGYGNYFSWTTAAGYNQFSIIHIFSIITGSISYRSPEIFFLLVNYFELFLLLISCLLFIRLAIPKIEVATLNQWTYALASSIILWTLICLFAGAAPQSIGLQVTDLFLIFVDNFIIISIGWFLFLLNKIFIEKKFSKLNISLFILFQLYFSLTTLRFLSGAILTEITLLIFIIISSKTSTKKKLNKKNNSNNSVLFVPLAQMSIACLIILSAIFVIGYFGFFIIEPYSTSARFVLRGGETSTSQAWGNAMIALTQYLAFTDLSYAVILLRLSYLGALCYGLKIIFQSLFFNEYRGFRLTLPQLFSLLTGINFILVTLAGLFSHGTVFLDVGNIGHYYELSAIFAFLTVIALILDKWKDFKQIKVFSLSTLILISLFSLYYLKAKKDVEFPMTKLLNCINLNKEKYHLKNGMGDFWVVNPLMAQTTGTRFSVIGTMATNLDYNWQRNLTEEVATTNFLLYTNQEYRANTLNLLNSKIPSLNYQEINCNNGMGIIVFDDKTAKYINQFRSTEFNNSKSWFYISNYGTGQTLWSKMPWNQQFVKEHHEYFYYGSLLRKTSQEAQYSVNDDLSIIADGQRLPQPQPVMMTEMVHAGKGSYYLNLHYELTGNANVFVVNLQTQQPISELILSQSELYKELSFNLDNVIPIAIVIVIYPSSKILLKDLTLGKLVD